MEKDGKIREDMQKCSIMEEMEKTEGMEKTAGGEHGVRLGFCLIQPYRKARSADCLCGGKTES
jgi:hypothetical protein